jgi:hypothetical protein
MLFHRFIQAIQTHALEITAATLAEFRRDPSVEHVALQPDAEVLSWGTEILKRLGTWVSGGDDEGMAAYYRERGATRLQQGVPLHEAVRGLQILKHKTVEFSRSEGFAQNAVEIYAQEELEFRINRFFDVVMYNLVRGYEEALKSSVRTAATATR